MNKDNLCNLYKLGKLGKIRMIKKVRNKILEWDGKSVYTLRNIIAEASIYLKASDFTGFIESLQFDIPRSSSHEFLNEDFLAHDNRYDNVLTMNLDIISVKESVERMKCHHDDLL